MTQPEIQPEPEHQPEPAAVAEPEPAGEPTPDSGFTPPPSSLEDLAAASRPKRFSIRNKQ